VNGGGTVANFTADSNSAAVHFAAHPYEKSEDLLGQNGLLKQLQKRLLEKALGAELTVHLITPLVVCNSTTAR